MPSLPPTTALAGWKSVTVQLRCRKSKRRKPRVRRYLQLRSYGAQSEARRPSSLWVDLVGKQKRAPRQVRRQSFIAIVLPEDVLLTVHQVGIARHELAPPLCASSPRHALTDEEEKRPGDGFMVEAGLPFRRREPCQR